MLSALIWVKASDAKAVPAKYVEDDDDVQDEEDMEKMALDEDIEDEESEECVDFNKYFSYSMIHDNTKKTPCFSLIYINRSMFMIIDNMIEMMKKKNKVKMMLWKMKMQM
jgi:hypothetical protein